MTVEREGFPAGAVGKNVPRSDYSVVASYGSLQEAREAEKQLVADGLPGVGIRIVEPVHKVLTPLFNMTPDRTFAWHLLAYVLGGMILGTAIGAPAGLLLAALPGVGDFNWWLGLIWGIMIIGATGGILGGMAGIATSREPDAVATDETGVMVEVHDGERVRVDRAAQLLSTLHPQRLYRQEPGG